MKRQEARKPVVSSQWLPCRMRRGRACDSQEADTHFTLGPKAVGTSSLTRTWDGPRLPLLFDFEPRKLLVHGAHGHVSSSKSMLYEMIAVVSTMDFIFASAVLIVLADKFHCRSGRATSLKSKSTKVFPPWLRLYSRLNVPTIICFSQSDIGACFPTNVFVQDRSQSRHSSPAKWGRHPVPHQLGSFPPD